MASKWLCCVPLLIFDGLLKHLCIFTIFSTICFCSSFALSAHDFCSGVTACCLWSSVCTIPDLTTLLTVCPLHEHALIPYKINNMNAQERDPIERVRKLLLEKELVSSDDLKNIDKEAKQMVNDAVAQAKESPPPDESQLFTYVYAAGLGAQAFGVDRKHRTAILQ